MKFLRSIGLAALLMVCASSAFADIYVSTTTEKGSVRSAIGFGTGDAINAISRAIPSCPTMSVTFFQATAAQVTLYEADPDDDAFGDLTTSVIAYTATSTSSHTFRPGKQFVRFKVVQAETSGSSVAVVNCINEVAKSETLWRGTIRSFSTTTGPLDASACIALNGHDGGANVGVIDQTIACTDSGTALGTRAGMWIDEISTVETTANTHTGRSCAVCLSIDGGANCLAGTTLEHPSTASGGEFSAAGEGEVIYPNLFIPGGSLVKPLLGDGSQCASGSCFCNSSTRVFVLKIKGREA
jgi:hypothetical protein